MAIRVLALSLPDAGRLVEVADALAGPLEARSVTLVAVGPVRAEAGAWWAVDPDAVGLAADAPELIAVAAAMAGAFAREVAVAAPLGASLADGARACGVPALVVDADEPSSSIAAGLLDALEQQERIDAEARGEVGVGPLPPPWPDDPRLDPALLGAGDRRNVIDRYRYWREEAIVADLDARRHPVHVAVENWRHDLNIGTVVRNANAFNVAGVHIVGERRWNRRGAMATDRYLPVHHHPSVDDLLRWAAAAGLPLVGVDNVPGARDLDADPLPPACVLLLGQEGPGLSAAALAACDEVVAIAQHGSTRSLNAGVASGIALHAWARDHAAHPPAWPEAPPVL